MFSLNFDSKNIWTPNRQPLIIGHLFQPKTLYRYVSKYVSACLSHIIQIIQSVIIIK